MNNTAQATGTGQVMWFEDKVIEGRLRWFPQV